MSWKFNPFTGKFDLVKPVAGSDGEVQFNDNGNFGADFGLNWDNTSKRLKVGESETITSGKTLDIAGSINFDTIKPPNQTACTLTGVSEGNLDDGATYYYSFSFIGGDGDTIAGYGQPGSPDYSTIVLAAGQTGVDITDIPTSADPRVTGRNIWRTVGNGSYYARYKLAIINDNTTTTYADRKADTDLGDEWTYRKDDTTIKGIYKNNIIFATLGDWNIGFGLYSLQRLTSGTQNYSFGQSANQLVTTGDNNIGIGQSANSSITTGYSNVGIGYATHNYNANCKNSIGIGDNSCRLRGTGFCEANVGVGIQSLYGLNNDNDKNVGLGYFAGKGFGGSKNIIIGAICAYLSSNIDIGDNNIFIGHNSVRNLTTGATRNILIGESLELPVSNGSNQLIIGNLIFGINADGTDKTISNGKIGIKNQSPLAVLDVIGDTRLGDSTTNYAKFDTDGELTLTGTARVYKNEWVNVQGLKAPGTKPAVIVDWGISFAWEFSDGTDDTICSSIRIPQDMDRTVAPELKIGFASDTNTGDVVWQLEYIYLSQNEDTTASAQETLTTTTTISGTADGLTIATITGLDLPSSTDQLMKMRIKRLGADGDDTLSDDCVLMGVGIKYVANKLGEAT